MGIYTRILLMIILTGIFFLLLLSILIVLKNKQEKIVDNESQVQFDNKIKSLINLKTATLKQVLYDYTYWDEFVENVYKGDTAWYNNNITTILKSFHFDYVCVYDTSYNLVHEASAGELALHDVISGATLAKLKETRFLNYFKLIDDGLFEISGASVHPDSDPSHTLTKPSGYIFILKSWNQDVLNELTLLSGSQTTLLMHNDSRVDSVKYTLSSIQKLTGWENENVAQIVFTRTSESLKLYHRMSLFMLFLFLGAIIMASLVSHYTIQRWINKPLKLVKIILKTSNLKEIEELKHCQGEFQDIGILFTDFIAQKEALRLAKECAEESERKVKNILDNSPFHIWECDGKKFKYVNKAYIDFVGVITGKELEKDINQWVRYIHPDDLEETKKRWKDAGTNEKEQNYYLRLLNKEGEYRDFWCYAVPIFDEQGTFQLFQGFSIDITERKLAEMVLYQERNDWENTFNSITDMITIHDIDYNIIRSNTAANRHLGLPEMSDLYRSKCFKYYHGTDCPPIGCPSCNCLNTGLPALFESFEPHLNIYLEIRSIPRFDIANNLIGLVHIVRDITERKKAEKEILKLNEELDLRVKLRTSELEEVNKELETFSYSVSHDLKTPLRHIKGFIELFLNNKATVLNEEELAYLKHVAGLVVEMELLIDAILSFSRLNQTELRKANIRSGDMVQQVIHIFEPEIRNRKIQFNIESLPDIQGDEQLIRLVWTNLISNAIKESTLKEGGLEKPL